MSCQETVQTPPGHVSGIFWQRVDMYNNLLQVHYHSCFLIWSESNLAISSIFATFTDFCWPGVLRNYPSRGGCTCCRKQLAASVWTVNGVTLGWDASYSSSTRKYLHTCIDCHRSGHSDCSYCGHATPSIRDNFMNCKGYNLCAGSTHGFTEDFLVTLRGFDRMLWSHPSLNYQLDRATS